MPSNSSPAKPLSRIVLATIFIKFWISKFFLLSPPIVCSSSKTFGLHRKRDFLINGLFCYLKLNSHLFKRVTKLPTSKGDKSFLSGFISAHFSLLANRSCFGVHKWMVTQSWLTSQVSQIHVWGSIQKSKFHIPIGSSRHCQNNSFVRIPVRWQEFVFRFSHVVDRNATVAGTAKAIGRAKPIRCIITWNVRTHWIFLRNTF